MGNSILEANKSYTFSDYFKLPYTTKEILAEFGYTFHLTKFELPRKHLPEVNLDRLRATFYKKLPHFSLNSEAAKREMLVAPILVELLDYMEIDVDIEYTLNVNRRLRGTIDYVVRAKQNLIVIEAKNADLDKGFTQLAVELIAMAEALGAESKPLLYGAVTVGEVWRWGRLDRHNKTVSRNLGGLIVPDDLEDLFAVLLGILDGSAA